MDFFLKILYSWLYKLYDAFLLKGKEKCKEFINKKRINKGKKAFLMISKNTYEKAFLMMTNVYLCVPWLV